MGESNRRYPCTPFRRKSCAELSAENEWNRKLYTFRSIASGGEVRQKLLDTRKTTPNMRIF